MTRAARGWDDVGRWSAARQLASPNCDDRPAGEKVRLRGRFGWILRECGAFLRNSYEIGPIS
jgi:mannose-1-phosphate guanylyltransferase